MEDHLSTYQSFKIWLAVYLPIERDILHVLIGLALVLAAMLLSRRYRLPVPFVWAFAVSCMLGVIMEALDARDDIQAFGFWRWGASIPDFARTVSVPLLALVVALFVNKKPWPR